MLGFTSILALKAIDGLTVRAEVVSQNIANANTPGYRSLKVSFEKALVEAATSGPDAVEAMQPKIETDTSAANNSGVRLDLEMATVSMTAARHAALVQILSMQMQQYRTAMGN